MQDTLILDKPEQLKALGHPLRVRVLEMLGQDAEWQLTNRELAQRLAFVYVNSGAMYRAITWDVLEHGIDPNDSEGIARFVQTAPIKCVLKENRSRILIGDVDPREHLREDRVNNQVSRVSTVPEVRKIVDEKMHQYAREYDLVVEGRDIGSVVFPDTPYKFYIDASPEVRLRRRAAEGQRDEITARDRADSVRRASPLIIAEDALVIDSSNLTIDGVVGEIRGLDHPCPRAGRQAGQDVLAVLLVLVPAGLPAGVGDLGDQGGGAAAEPPGQHRQGRLPGAAGGQAGSQAGGVVLDGVVQQRGAGHVGSVTR